LGKDITSEITVCKNNYQQLKFQNDERKFFNQIQALDFTGVLQLNISKGAESNLIVSVLLKTNNAEIVPKTSFPH
jgi:hypothetical protein